MINKIYKSVLITGASSGIGLETLKRFFKDKNATQHFPAEGEATLSGIIIEADHKTGLAKKITRLIKGGSLIR